MRSRSLVSLIALVSTTMGLASVIAAPAYGADDARALMLRVFKRSNWRDMQGTIRLILTNKRGDQRRREIEMYSKRNDQDESRMLMRFVKPADVRGTAFLQVEHQNADDDRRLYLPAMRRVQRLSAAESGGNFMSSDFTYYDIGMPKVEDWRFSFVDGKTIDGVQCKGLQGLPANADIKEETGYGKVIWYVDSTRLIALGAAYFDKEGVRFKQMHSRKVELVDGTLFATEMEMRDVTTGHMSEMIFEGLQTNRGLADSLFTERSLRKRVR